MRVRVRVLCVCVLCVLCVYVCCVCMCVCVSELRETHGQGVVIYYFFCGGEIHRKVPAHVVTCECVPCALYAL